MVCSDRVAGNLSFKIRNGKRQSMEKANNSEPKVCSVLFKEFWAYFLKNNFIFN
jgi:hypothetical protein